MKQQQQQDEDDNTTIVSGKVTRREYRQLEAQESEYPHHLHHRGLKLSWCVLIFGTGRGETKSQEETD